VDRVSYIICSCGNVQGRNFITAHISSFSRKDLSSCWSLTYPNLLNTRVLTSGAFLLLFSPAAFAALLLLCPVFPRLESIRLRAKNSCVIIVGTHIDEKVSKLVSSRGGVLYFGQKCVADEKINHEGRFARPSTWRPRKRRSRPSTSHATPISEPFASSGAWIYL